MSLALAEAGAGAIALLDVKRGLGDTAAEELGRSAGIPVRFYGVDVRDGEAVEEAVGEVGRELGGVDVVVNSAGVVE